MRLILCFVVLATAAAQSVVLNVTAGPAASADKTRSVGDTCRNVSFRVTNGKNVAIDIKKVKYYNQSEARWVTENVKNKSEHCGKGQVCQMDKEDLGNAENDALTKFIFVYQDVGSNVEHESATFVPTNPECRAEKVYGYGQVWSIAASTSETTDGAGPCDVKFEYKNGKSGKIKVTTVKYFTGGKWKTEDVSAGSNDCPAGQVCSTVDFGSGIDKKSPNTKNPFDTAGVINVIAADAGGTSGAWSRLGGTQGADITKIKFVYKFLPPGKGANWSDKVESKTFVPDIPKCTTHKVYGNGMGWTIK